MTTRAAAKQQEMEEQMAKLLELAGQQQRRQEELARQQQERQEELAGQQQRRQEELAQEQREQVDRLMDEQQQQLKLLMQRQKEAEQHAGVLEERVGAAEATLVSLTSTQQGLAEELRAGHSSLRRELQEELQTVLEKLRQREGVREKATPRTLDVSAPEFVPYSSCRDEDEGGEGSRGGGADADAIADGGCGGGGDGGARGAVQRPPQFDGRSPWEAYLTQFQMLAKLSHWSERQKTTFLAVSLRGPALTVLTNLPEERRNNYEALVAALQNRFGTAHQAELHRMKLKNRVRKREESLPELVEDVERLVRLAYPDAAPTILEVLAKDHFVDALTDDDMKLRIRQSRPGSLQQALETALELESYQLVSRGRSRPVRTTQLDGEKPLETRKRGKQRSPVSGEALGTLQQCVHALQRLTAGMTKAAAGGHRGQAGRKRWSPQSKSLTCWGCGEEGHLRRDCKKRPDEPDPARSPSVSQDQGNER